MFRLEFNRFQRKCFKYFVLQETRLCRGRRHPPTKSRANKAPNRKKLLSTLVYYFKKKTKKTMKIHSQFVQY